MDDRIVFNYQLLFRFRRKPIWLTLYLTMLFEGLLATILMVTYIAWAEMFLLLMIYYLLYLFWGIWYLRFFKKGIKLRFPYLPWFGLAPAKMLTLHEYYQFELSYLFIGCFSSIWFILWFPSFSTLFSIIFVLSLFIFRLFLFIKVTLLKNSNILIKYEPFGISVYKTDRIQ